MKITNSLVVLLILATLCNAKKKLHRPFRGKIHHDSKERTKKENIILPGEGVSGNPALANIPGVGVFNNNQTGLILTGNNSVVHAASIGAFVGAKAGARSGAKTGANNGAKAGAQAGAEAGQDAGVKAGEEAGKKIAHMIALEALQKILIAQMQNGHVFNIYSPQGQKAAGNGKGVDPSAAGQGATESGGQGGAAGKGGARAGAGVEGGAEAGGSVEAGGGAGTGVTAGGAAGASAGGSVEAGAEAGAEFSVAGVSLSGAAAGGGAGAGAGASAGAAAGAAGAAGAAAGAGGYVGGAASSIGIGNVAIAKANAAAAAAVSASGAATKIIHGALYLIYSINRPALQDYNNNMCLYGIDGQIYLGKYCQYFIAHVPALNRDPNTVSFEPFCYRGSYLAQKNYKFLIKPWHKGVPYAMAASFYVFRRTNLQETFSFGLVQDNWFLATGPSSGSKSWHVIAAYDNSTIEFSQDTSFIVKPYEVGKDQNMNCKPPTDTSGPETQPGSPGSSSSNGKKCVSLEFVNEASSAVQLISNVNNKTWILSGKKLKIELSFTQPKLHHFITFEGRALDPVQKFDVLLDGDKTISVVPKTDCSTYTTVIVTTVPASEVTPQPGASKQPMVSGTGPSPAKPALASAGGVHYHYHFNGVPEAQCPTSCQTSCPAPACPQTCCNNQMVRSKILDSSSRKIKQSCNCVMECNGTNINGDEHCHEQCTCTPDHDELANKTAGGLKISPRPKPKFALAELGGEGMKKLQKVFTDWLKSPVGKDQDNRLKNGRAQFVEKMLKNYEHLRERAKDLQVLQKQQKELRKQQDILGKTISYQGNRLKEAKQHLESSKVDHNDPEILGNTDVTKYLNKIRAQLTTLQEKQNWLEKEQDLLIIQLRQSMLAQQGQSTQEDESETGADEVADQNGEYSSRLTASQQLQNVFSKLANDNARSRSINNEDDQSYTGPLYNVNGEDPEENSWSNSDEDGEDQEFTVVEKKTLHYGSGKEALPLRKVEKTTDKTVQGFK